MDVREDETLTLATHAIIVALFSAVRIPHEYPIARLIYLCSIPMTREKDRKCGNDDVRECEIMFDFLIDAIE